MREEGRHDACDKVEWLEKSQGRGRTHPRWVRPLAVFAAAVTILTAFSALSRTVAAESTPLDLTQGGTAGGTAYGPGFALSPTVNGTLLATNLATFTRWDGVVEPYANLSFSAGRWPYLLGEDANSFTVTRGSLAFTQGKVTGAAYGFQLDRIKETIRINTSFPVPVLKPSIFVPFSTSYLGRINGTRVSLYDYSGAMAWTTSPFHAWDSADTPHVWENAVASIEVAQGGLNLILDLTVTDAAVFPLYVDPTWDLGGAVGWGASTLQDATMDAGDGSVKIGWLADNFNDNVNELWTLVGATISGGKLNLPASGNFAYHAASWLNLNAAFDVYFGGRASPNWLRFKFGATSEVGASNSLYIKEDSDQMTLVSPDGTTWAQFSVTISTRRGTPCGSSPRATTSRSGGTASGNSPGPWEWGR